MSEEQPPPKSNDERPVWEQVIEDMQARDRLGRERYGTPLQPFNGRNALQDAYEEALDLAVYLKQELIQRAANQQYIIKLPDESTPETAAKLEALRRAMQAQTQTTMMRPIDLTKDQRDE